NCGIVTATLINSDVSGTDCAWTATYTYTIRDDCFNMGQNAVVTFSGGDTEAPTLTGILPGGDIGNSCMSDAPAAPSAASIGALYSDNCGIVTATLTSSSVTGNDCDWTATYTYTVEDECQNFAPNAVVVYTGGDTEDPYWINSPPTNVQVPCATDPIPFWDPKNDIDYDDNCDSNPALVLVIDHDIIPQPDGTKWHIRSWRVDDICQNQSSVVTQTIVELRCQFSSLTQGFYGNQGGTYCGNGYGTTQLLSGLLAPSLTVGIPSNNGSLTMLSADASCVIQYLPSGGTAAALQAHDYVFGNNCKFVPGNFSQLNNGRFYNILLGQTITFALNLRLDPHLTTDIKLPPTTLPYLWTMEANYVNGICLDGNDVEVPLSTKGWYIPPSVITALQSMLPAATDFYLPDLLALANRGLAGLGTYGASLTDITQALDAYNKGFDGARFFAGYHAAIPKRDGTEVMPEGFALHQNHPNPFNPATTIKYTVPVECQVRLVVYNALGESVAVLVDARVPAGTHYVTWESNLANTSLASGVYTYRMQAVGPDGIEFSDVRKMMLVK
ncbi:hypothetical protein KQI65_17465, partial [bacterium]|nr:hypothetical protein [bacterium]